MEICRKLLSLSRLVSHYNRKSTLLTEVTDECIAQSFHCWQTPFPFSPVSFSHAAHAPVLRCLHVKLNFYTNREREWERASCIDPQPPPQAFASAPEKWKDHRIQEESGISILYAVYNIWLWTAFNDDKCDKLPAQVPPHLSDKMFALKSLVVWVRQHERVPSGNPSTEIGLHNNNSNINT